MLFYCWFKTPRPWHIIEERKLEAERANLKWYEFFKTSKPTSTGIPPAKPYLKSLPKQPPTGDQIFKTMYYGGHLIQTITQGKDFMNWLHLQPSKAVLKRRGLGSRMALKRNKAQLGKAAGAVEKRHRYLKSSVSGENAHTKCIEIRMRKAHTPH